MKYLKKGLSLILTLSIILTMLIVMGVQTSAANSDDYRTWTHRDSRWSSTAMGTSTLGNGGAPTTAITKLAIQAGLRDPHDFDIGDMATLLTNNSGYSGSSIIWNAPTQASLNLFTSKEVFYDNSTGVSAASKYSDIITKLGLGWHLVIEVKNSSGKNYVAVDEKLTLADGSKVYIMDCLSNTSNNINVVLGKRYTTITKIIGYQGGATQSSSINSDYRKWEVNNSNWADTVLNGTKTISNTNVGGGDLVLASTKLAIQAGLLSDEIEGGVNSVNRAVNLISAQSGFNSDGSIKWSETKTAYGFDSVNSELIGDAADFTGAISTSIDSDSNGTNDIIDKINEGYYLAIRINGSVGWVAVDTEKTLRTGEVYILRSTPDASKNANIKLTDYYDTMNRVAGFKAGGVKVTFSGSASFSAKYVPDGGSDEISFSSGSFVPDEAVVTITATPDAGYNAADNWTITGGYSGVPTSSSTTYNFVADKDVSTTAVITYTPTPKTYDINYSYGTNSSSFNYTTVPAAASTGATVNMTVSPKTDGSFVYELIVEAKDSSNNTIPVTQSGTTYSFTMPASDVTVTFSGQNVEDWRRWARDDERWRDKEMAPKNGETTYTVFSDGAVMISLSKMVIQAGLQTPTTLESEAYDVNDVVDALKSAGKINSAGGLTFDNTTATTLGFASYHQFIKVDNSSEDIYSTASKRKDLVDQLKQGYHQIIRLYDGSGNSEWFIIDEEKTLAAAGNKDAVDLEDIYIYRATADSSVNSNYNLQQLYDAKGYRYIRRNYAFLGGTTPSRKVNFTIKKDGAALENEHKGAVAATYTIEGESTSFVSGDYVPSRSTVKFKYNADTGYYAFENWTTPDTSVTSLSATETANPKEFTVNSSDFRTAATTANISCNVTPEEYHIYYTDGSNFTYSNNADTAGYNDSVSFTINPDSGYTVDAADVVFKDAGDSVIGGLSASKTNRTYSFTMPAKDVYISATATTQTYDDFRTWGVGDTRWKEVYIRNTSTTRKMGDAISGGGDAIMAFAKLLIQSGYPTQLKTDLSNVLYDGTNSSNNSTFMNSFINQAVVNYSGYKVVANSGILHNNSSYSGFSGEWGMAAVAKNLSIIGSLVYTNNDKTKITYNDGATAGGNRDQAFVYTQLLKKGCGNGGTTDTGATYDVETFTDLIIDYLAGTNTVTTGFGSYDSIYNAHNYKFHIMLYINDDIGWVAVDEARTLNTGKIWVWASHGKTTNNVSGTANVFCLNDDNSITTFVRAAGFKFSSTYNLYGTDAAEFTTSNATLRGSYSYLGQSYGPYTSVMYVPHGATVTVTRTAIADHYTPSTSQTYGAWTSSGGTVTPTSYSATNLLYDTSYQGATSSRHTYDIQYVVDAIPQVHLKFLGDAHGTLYGARTTLSDEAIYYEGDSVVIAPVPDANYEVDTLTVRKVSSFADGYTILSTEGLDPDDSSVTFGSDRTGGAESYFIVQATFRGYGLRITYNFKEYDPSKSGTYEYVEGDTFDEYLTSKSYTVSIDSYDPTAENAIRAQVIAHAPVLQNVYFNYTLDTDSITSSTEATPHTATVTMTPIEKLYTVSVNGSPIEGTFHYQEEIALDSADYDVDSEDVVWRSGAESGKAGSAAVCYDTIYSFRVTGDLNLTVDENLTSRSSVDGTSAIVPGYTEVKIASNVEKCTQNFYVQDFFDTEAPRVYDASGEVIDDAEDVTFLGAGVLFYSYNTDTNQPKKAAFGGVEPTRETVNSVLTSNSSAFLTEATAQGSSFKGSNLNYSYIKASTDNGSILRYSTVTDSYNYFFSTTITNDRTPENQKYVFRVYSFYVCSYTLNGNTYVAPVLSGSYAQAKVYSTAV